MGSAPRTRRVVCAWVLHNADTHRHSSRWEWQSCRRQRLCARTHFSEAGREIYSQRKPIELCVLEVLRPTQLASLCPSPISCAYPPGVRVIVRSGCTTTRSDSQTCSFLCECPKSKVRDKLGIETVHRSGTKCFRRMREGVGFSETVQLFVVVASLLWYVKVHLLGFLLLFRFGFGFRFGFRFRQKLRL